MKRFVVAQIKHETNTFSPIDTPLASFGHGEGPLHGEAAKVAFAGTNSPFAAFLDVGVREGAEVATPIAAESWPSNRASRATFEALVRPVEDAVRRGCDAVLLDLHGAMVVEGADGTVMLEWTSDGRALTGGTVRYAGVSVVEMQNNRVRRFRTYFDTRELETQAPRRDGAVTGTMRDAGEASPRGITATETPRISSVDSPLGTSAEPLA